MTQAYIPVLGLTVRATAVIPAQRFVTLAGIVTGADLNSVGVSRTAAAIGELMTVDVLGTAVVETGAAVTLNATVKSDATGRAINWATAGAKVAIALEAATAAGQFIEVLLVQNAV